ncbi:hypothetical protein SRABI80_03893 [Peribacillus frigoritolerans]|nr:hypothetical protein SRABI80_03893 [Peribacillus frigoritolerans]
MLSYPYKRAASSTKSASIVISPRRVGTVIVNVSLSSSTPNCRRLKIDSTTDTVMLVPRSVLIFSSVMLMTAGSIDNSSTSAAPCKTVPPAYCAINCAARSPASRTRAGSTPFSKRALASLRNPWSFEALRTTVPAKYALSIMMFVVSFLTSESAPPITPAIATGSLPFVITKWSGVKVRSASSNVTIFSASFALRMTISFEPKRS